MKKSPSKNDLFNHALKNSTMWSGPKLCRYYITWLYSNRFIPEGQGHVVGHD